MSSPQFSGNVTFPGFDCSTSFVAQFAVFRLIVWGAASPLLRLQTEDMLEAVCKCVEEVVRLEFYKTTSDLKFSLLLEMLTLSFFDLGVDLLFGIK